MRRKEEEEEKIRLQQKEMAVALSLSAAFSMSSQNRIFTVVHALGNPPILALTVRGCSSSLDKTLRTCKNCKTQFDPLLNHPRACRFHTAHFGGETKRKFESVYSGGTLNTPDSGKVNQYWHCCGSEDPFDPGCTPTPHASYDD